MRLIFLSLIVSFVIFPYYAHAASEQLIVINKTNNTLSFFDQGKLIKTFDVATGRKDSYTPEGKFRIVNKIKNRPYYKENIPGGDPRNPLGDRWLGLEARGTYGTTYGIHGNNNDNSIGKYISAGCIRMFNQDVRWLFEQVKNYTSVVILHTKKDPKKVARDYGYSLSPNYQIFINTEKQQFNTDITYRNGRILVPLRGIFEQLGANVTWHPKEKSIVASKDGVNIFLKIGSKHSMVNSKEIILDSPPEIVNQKTLVPLRFVSESMGAYVEYDGENKTVNIVYNDQQ